MKYALVLLTILFSSASSFAINQVRIDELFFSYVDGTIDARTVSATIINDKNNYIESIENLKSLCRSFLQRVNDDKGQLLIYKLEHQILADVSSYNQKVRIQNKKAQVAGGVVGGIAGGLIGFKLSYNSVNDVAIIGPWIEAFGTIGGGLIGGVVGTFGAGKTQEWLNKPLSAPTVIEQ